MPIRISVTARDIQAAGGREILAAQTPAQQEKAGEVQGMALKCVHHSRILNFKPMEPKDWDLSGALEDFQTQMAIGCGIPRRYLETRHLASSTEDTASSCADYRAMLDRIAANMATITTKWTKKLQAVQVRSWLNKRKPNKRRPRRFRAI